MRSSVENTRLLAGAAVVLALITYPVHNVQLHDTADHVLKWLFNYLIAHQPAELKDLHFPHGPLAFLQYPLPGHPLFYLAIAVQSLVRISLAFLFLRQRVVYHLRQRSWSIILLLILLLVVDFRFSVLFLVLLLLEEFRLSRQLAFAALAALLAAMAIYIRAYFGIITWAGFYTSLIFLYGNGSSPKLTNRGWAAILPPVFATLIWLFLFGRMTDFPDFWTGFVQLSLGNSSAVGLYPDNAWWLLLPAIILMLTFLLKTTMKSRMHLGLSLSVVFLLTLKYSLSRQDYGHILPLVQLCCAAGILLLALTPAPFRFLKFLLPALFGFYVAFFISNNTKAYRFTLIEPWTYFGYFLTDNAQHELSETQQKVAGDYELAIPLPDNVETIDCYPYNYYPAMYSGLRLSPPPVVQAYAAYTPWLDAQDSAHFYSQEAADLLVWHDNPREGFFELLGQYLLNEEPKSLLAMMAGYEPYAQANEQLVYRQRTQPLSWQMHTAPTFSASWNSWISLPEDEDPVLRLKAGFQKSFTGTVVGALLKETAVFVEYRLQDGSRHKYRLNPLNAQSGIWVKPFMENPFAPCRPAGVEALRFTALDHSHYLPQIQLRWQFASLPGKPASEMAQQWFGKCNSCRPHLISSAVVPLRHQVFEISPFTEESFDLDISEFTNDSLQLTARVSFEARNSARTDAYAYLTAVFPGSEEGDSRNLNRFPVASDHWEYHSLQVPVDSSIIQLQLKLANERKEAFEVKNLRLEITGHPHKPPEHSFPCGPERN